MRGSDAGRCRAAGRPHLPAGRTRPWAAGQRGGGLVGHARRRRRRGRRVDPATGAAPVVVVAPLPSVELFASVEVATAPHGPLSAAMSLSAPQPATPTMAVAASNAVSRGLTVRRTLEDRARVRSTTIKGLEMRAKGLGATVAVVGLAAVATTGIVVPASTGASREKATAAQDQAALAIVKAKAFTRSVKLRRRAPLAEWAVRNTSQIDATNVNTCVQFPRGFEIKWKAERPAGRREDHEEQAQGVHPDPGRHDLRRLLVLLPGRRLRSTQDRHLQGEVHRDLVERRDRHEDGEPADPEALHTQALPGLHRD